MRGPACIFWADLTPFSREGLVAVIAWLDAWLEHEVEPVDDLLLEAQLGD
jgi:hypothetical protein